MRPIFVSRLYIYNTNITNVETSVNDVQTMYFSTE